MAASGCQERKYHDSMLDDDGDDERKKKKEANSGHECMRVISPFKR
jgi:hypothetical protein